MTRSAAFAVELATQFVLASVVGLLASVALAAIALLLAA
jgi:hypothetical protein